MTSINIVNLLKSIVTNDINPQLTELSAEIGDIEKYSFQSPALIEKQNLLTHYSNIYSIVKSIIDGTDEMTTEQAYNLLNTINKLFGTSYNDIILVDTYGDAKPEDTGEVNLTIPPTLKTIELFSETNEGYIASGVFASMSEAYPSQIADWIEPGESVLQCGQTETWLQGEFTKYPSNEWVKFPTTSDNTAYRIKKVIRGSGYTIHYIDGIIPASEIGSRTPIYVLGATSTDYSVKITWENDPAHIGFEIFKNGTSITNVGGTKEYTDTNIERGEIYTFNIKGIDSDGKVSSLSNQLTIKAGESLAPPVLDPIVAKNDGSVVLTWNAVPGAVKYNIYRDGSIVDVQTVTSLVQDAYSVSAGTEYSYYIKSVAEDGFMSAASNTENVVPLRQIKSPTITEVTYNSDTNITLNWTYHNTGIEKGSIYMDGVFYKDVAWPGLSTSVTIPTPNKETEIRMTAWIGGRQSDFSGATMLFPTEDPGDLKLWLNDEASTLYSMGKDDWPADGLFRMKLLYSGSMPVSRMRARFYYQGSTYIGDMVVQGTGPGTKTFNLSSYSKGRVTFIVDLYDSSYTRLKQQVYYWFR